MCQVGAAPCPTTTTAPTKKPNPGCNAPPAWAMYSAITRTLAPLDHRPHLPKLAPKGKPPTAAPLPPINCSNLSHNDLILTVQEREKPAFNRAYNFLPSDWTGLVPPTTSNPDSNRLPTSKPRKYQKLPRFQLLNVGFAPPGPPPLPGRIPLPSPPAIY